MLKPRVLAVLPAVVPSTTIGVIKPLTKLHRTGQISADLTLEYMVSRRQVERADVVVFCRNTEPSERNALTWALASGKTIIYELDDDLLDIPLDMAQGQYHRSPERQNQLRHYLESADLVRVYAKHLKEKVAAINPSVEQVVGPVDWSLVPASPSPKARHEKLRLIYATSRLTDQLANIFLDDVVELLREFPDRVELFLWGCRSEQLEPNPSVKFLSHVANYNRFFHKFARYGFDIGLAPLPNEDFYLSKSNNKFREYAACGIAGVYSNVNVYSECVEHGVTGLLVENRRGAWFQALARLVEDIELRKRVQAQAQQYARQHYSQDNFCGVWLEQIHTLLARKSAATIFPMASLDASSESEATTKAQPLTERAVSALKILLRFAGQTKKVAINIKLRGVRETVAMATWAVNDLSLLFWKWC
jgi:glycosyltransferase involved in cell wall biosynthesis